MIASIWKSRMRVKELIWRKIFSRTSLGVRIDLPSSTPDYILIKIANIWSKGQNKKDITY